MSSNKPPLLQVAAKAAIINDDGQVLIVRESPADKNNVKVGLWGLVGGRLESSETFFDGLRREVTEETGLVIVPLKPLYVGEWHPVIIGVPHQIIAIFMLCRASGSHVKLSSEHDKYLWIDPKKRSDYQVMEPDCFAVDAINQ